MMRRSNSRSAFTFLEIMMVVVIIGILVALVAPRLTGKAAQAKKAAAKSDIRALEGALAQYEMDMGAFPEQSTGLKGLMEKPSDDEEDSWNGPYLRKSALPKDPWKQDYQYRFPGERNTKDFDLWSNGPDKQSGTEDDIVNWDKTDERR